MTAVQAARIIGQEGALRASPGLAVAVRILDVKSSYGTLRYLVTPLQELGEEWVDARRVVLVGEVR
jgi:hypothetical protein